LPVACRDAHFDLLRDFVGAKLLIEQV